MPAVVLALALLGGASWEVAYAFGAQGSPAAQSTVSEGGVAPSVPPEPSQDAPQARVDQAHRALHALGRACRKPIAVRDPDAVSRPTGVIVAFARDHPGSGFRIDGEPGSTLTLLIVVRNVLESCDPMLVPKVDAFIPRAYRP